MTKMNKLTQHKASQDALMKLRTIYFSKSQHETTYYTF